MAALLRGCCLRQARRPEDDGLGEPLPLVEQAAPKGMARSYRYKHAPVPEAGLRRQDDALEEDLPRAPRDRGEFLSSLATVSMVLLLFLFEAGTYNGIFLWRILPARGKDMFILPFLVLFNSAWALALWSYLQAHRTDPGLVPKRWQEFCREVGDALYVAPARLEWQPGTATWCKRCMIPRPERAHHCQACGACVLRMDHHCPYIFNCVGFNNHKFFLLLLIYASLACTIALLTTLPELVYCTVALSGGPRAEGLQVSEICGLLLSGVAALLLELLLLPMVPAHVALAARNLTSIETNYTNSPNPFDQGAAGANLAQIFGAYGPDWFFPVLPVRPICDGISFLRSDVPLGAEASEVAVETEDCAENAERLWRRRYEVQLPGAAAAAAAQGAARHTSISSLDIQSPLAAAATLLHTITRFLHCVEKK